MLLYAPLLVALVVSGETTDMRVFPDAYGFGTTTPGGRGGKILFVMNLNDSGPGSLREAVATEGPRTIVFRIGGTIVLDSPIQILHPYCTIAGQSAPGGGITLTNSQRNIYAPLQIKTHDVVVRYLRSRPGLSGIPPAGHEGSTVDALTIGDRDREVYNVVIDHCSLSWSVDEVLNTWYNSHDITIQSCILAEGLHNPPGRQGDGSKGPLLGGKGSDRISFHHNLVAHNVGRNPMIKGTGVFQLINNVIIVPRNVAIVVDGELGPCHVILLANRVIAPNGDGMVHGVRVLGSRPVSLFLSRNIGPIQRPGHTETELFVSPGNRSRNYVVSKPRPAPPVIMSSADAAYAWVLSDAGATKPQRDAVDERIVTDVERNITRVVTDPAEVGGLPRLEPGRPPIDSDNDGLPDDWERAKRLNPTDPSDALQIPFGQPYTNLEIYLNQL